MPKTSEVDRERGTEAVAGRPPRSRRSGEAVGPELATLKRQLAEAREEHRKFVSMVSHEFRTHLAAIQGVHFLLGKKLPGLPAAVGADFERLLKLQQQAMQAYQALLEKVGRLNKVEQACAGPQLGDFNGPKLLETIVAAWNGKADAVRAELHLGGTGAWIVRGDESLLQTAIEELLAYVEGRCAQHGRIGVEAEASADGWCLRVAVREGSPSAEVPVSALQSSGRDRGGHGEREASLRLTIVKRVAELHGAVLRRDDTPGAPETFTLQFPNQPLRQTAFP